MVKQNLFDILIKKFSSEPIKKIMILKKQWSNESVLLEAKIIWKRYIME